MKVFGRAQYFAIERKSFLAAGRVGEMFQGFVECCGVGNPYSWGHVDLILYLYEVYYLFVNHERNTEGEETGRIYYIE